MTMKNYPQYEIRKKPILVFALDTFIGWKDSKKLMSDVEKVNFYKIN